MSLFISINKIFQGGYGGGQNWGPNPGIMRRQESFKVKLGFISNSYNLRFSKKNNYKHLTNLRKKID